MQGRRLSSSTLCTASTYFLTYTHPTKEHTRALLGAIITQHALLVGIQGRISPLQKEDILRLVASQFAHLSLEEIYKALQLERYGAYGEHTQHYQLVNATYLSQILAKYQDWIRQLRQTHRISTTPKEEVQERSSSGYLSPRAICSEYPSCLSGLLPAGGATVLQRGGSTYGLCL